MSIYTASDWMSAKTYLETALGDAHRTADTIANTRLQLTQQFMTSPVFAIRNYFYTVDKRTKLDVPLDPFIGQTMIDCAIEQQRRAGLPQRVWEIKPRQVGWTTWHMARGLWASLHFNTNTCLLIDDEDVVVETMLKVTAMLSNLPGWLTPDIRIQNLKQIVFEQPNPRLRQISPGLNSSFVVTVPAEMRGIRPPNYLILSELAKYDDPEGVMSAMASGIGVHENTCIIVDTTPRGYDDYYYPETKEIVNRNPTLRKFWERNTIPTREEIINSYPEADVLGDFIPVFCPWFWHEAYTTKDESPHGHYAKMRPQDWDWMKDTLGDMKQYGDAEESELLERFNVSVPRLFWRRKVIDGYIVKGGDWRRKLITFRQEFASTWDSCFVDYGDTPFDPLCMDAVRLNVREPSFEGLFNEDPLNPGKGVYLEKKYDQWQTVRVYHIPKDIRERKTIMAVDCANSFENVKADQTVCQVLDRETLEQLMVYTARVPQYKLKEQLWRMYRFLGNPLLVVETAGIGFSLVRDLFDLGCTNQYRYKRFDTDVLDPDSKWLGWETNFRTKPVMDDALTECICHYDREGNPDPLVIIYDKLTFQELATLARYGEDGIKARGKNKDDHPMSLAIGLAMNSDYTVAVRRNREKSRAWPKNSLAVRYNGLMGGRKDELTLKQL